MDIWEKVCAAKAENLILVFLCVFNSNMHFWVLFVVLFWFFINSVGVFSLPSGLCSCLRLVQLTVSFGIPICNGKYFLNVRFELAYFSVIYLNMQMLYSSLWYQNTC